MEAEPHKCSGILEVMATCRDCGWESEAKNAMGNAARHASRTGHWVDVTQALGVSFNCRSAHGKPVETDQMSLI